MRGIWLEMAARAMERIESQIRGSHIVPMVLLMALAFSVYFTADVLLEIYRLHPLIVFVMVGYGPPPL